MSKKFTESEIIEGLKNNDRRVLNELFEEFYKPLHYFAANITRDLEEAKDIASSSFSTFWNLRNNFESLANIKAFLYITARNRCLDFIRYRKRQTENKNELTSHLISIDQKDDIERLIVESDFLSKVFHEVQQLPLQCKEVFFLTYFSELSAGEIAAKLNISVSTVTTQRSRAIKYLRNILKDENYLFLYFLIALFNNDDHISLY
jgi:RNA polymerase sigma-70 factor (family 1)